MAPKLEKEKQKKAVYKDPMIEQVFLDRELQGMYERLIIIEAKFKFFKNLKRHSIDNKEEALKLKNEYDRIKLDYDRIVEIEKTKVVQHDEIAKIDKIGKTITDIERSDEYSWLWHRDKSSFLSYKKKIEAGEKPEDMKESESESDEEGKPEEQKYRPKQTEEYKKNVEDMEKEIYGISMRGEPEMAKKEVRRFVEVREKEIQGVDADKKKVEFYNIMRDANGITKQEAHEKIIDIITKPGKEEYTTGNLNKPVNPKINPQSIKMQKFNEALNIVTARPVAIKSAPHYEHPSQKLKMALKNFNTL